MLLIQSYLTWTKYLHLLDSLHLQIVGWIILQTSCKIVYYNQIKSIATRKVTSMELSRKGTKEKDKQR